MSTTSEPTTAIPQDIETTLVHTFFCEQQSAAASVDSIVPKQGPLELLEHLIYEAQVAVSAASAYAQKPVIPGEIDFDVDSHLGAAYTQLQAAMNQLRKHLMPQELPTLPTGVAVIAEA